MAQHDRNRPGLVYGPVRRSGPPDRGRIFGNLLGLLVLAVSAGVLGFAALLVLENNGRQSLPPTVGVSPMPTLEPSATPFPIETPIALPTALPTAFMTSMPTAVLPTPAPTPFIPAVQAGPGFITFGTTADETLHVVDPKTTFAIDEPIVWRAYLLSPTDSADLRIRIYRFDPLSPTGQTLFREDAVKPDARGVQIFLRHLRPLGPTAGPGLYTVQYVRGEDVLAAGSFVIIG